MVAHLQTPPPDIRSINPQLPERTAIALLKAMAKEPLERFDSASELARAITGE
jgi:serine/threonine-protein kinase